MGLDTSFREGSLWNANAKPLLHLAQLLILKVQATTFIKDWSSVLSLLMSLKTSYSQEAFFWLYSLELSLSLVLFLHDTTLFSLYKGGLDHRKKDGKSRSELYSNLWGWGDEFVNSDLTQMPGKSFIQLCLSSSGSLQFSERNLKGPAPSPLQFVPVPFPGWLDLK